MRCLQRLAHLRAVHHGSIMVGRPTSLLSTILEKAFASVKDGHVISESGTDCSLAVAVISIGYASLLHYIKTFDRRLAVALYTESKASVNPADRRASSLSVGLLGGDNGRRVSLIPPNQAGYSAIETGAGRMGM